MRRRGEGRTGEIATYKRTKMRDKEKEGKREEIAEEKGRVAKGRKVGGRGAWREREREEYWTFSTEWSLKKRQSEPYTGCPLAAMKRQKPKLQLHSSGREKKARAMYS